MIDQQVASKNQPESDEYDACQWGIATAARSDGEASHDARLRFSRDMVDATLITTDKAVLLLDAYGCVLKANPAFTRITGYPEGEIAGRLCDCFQSAPLREAFIHVLLNTVGRCGYWAGEVNIQRKQGGGVPIALRMQSIGQGERRSACYLLVFTEVARGTRRSLGQVCDTKDHTSRVAEMVGAALGSLRVAANGRPARLALLLVRLDQFKTIDAEGRAMGDILLAVVTRRITACMAGDGSAIQAERDTYVAVLPSADEREAARTARHLQQIIAEPVALAGRQFSLSASVGISLYPSDGDDTETLLACASSALKRCGQYGRASIHFFSSPPLQPKHDGQRLADELSRAVSDQTLFLQYQPLIDMESGGTFGIETLVRWRRADGALVPPAHFIPEADASGHIEVIGDWVLRQACRQGVALREAGFDSLQVAINLSPRQFTQANLVEHVRLALAETGFPADCLALELTETMLWADVPYAKHTLHALRELGVSLALDNVGRGPLSLANLKQFCLDRLKIDRCCISGCCADPLGGAIVDTVLAIARHLGLQVVAEGVEREAQAMLLHNLGCQKAQGFWYSRPLDAEAIGNWLVAHQPVTATSGTVRGSTC